MNDAELQKMISELSDRGLRKWCLETAIEQVAKVGHKSGIIRNGFESVQELEDSHMSLANAYYLFLTGLKDAKPVKELDISEPQAALNLLLKRNMKTSPVSFNKKMVALGLMVTKKAASGYNYKELTEKGLAYGENKNSPYPNSPTQPIYYDDKFDELLNLLDIRK